MRVLIIGGTGLVGPYVLQELWSALPDVELHTVTRSGRRYFVEKAHQADRNNPKKLQRLIDELSPDALIDMIPFTEFDAINLVKSIDTHRNKIPIIAMSSIDVYSAYAKIHKTEIVDYQEVPITEEMSLRNLLGFEGKKYDKLNVEKVYLKNFKDVTILRLPAIYGWPDKQRIEQYLEPMLGGLAEIFISRQRESWKFSRCLHKNVAYAVVAAIEANQSGQHIFNVAEEHAYTEREWCAKIAQFCGWQGQILISNDDDEKTDLRQNFVVSTRKIRKEIGYAEKYSPDQGLCDSIKQYAYERSRVTYTQCY